MTIPTESELVPATTAVAQDTDNQDTTPTRVGNEPEVWTGELHITPDIVADILHSNNLE